MKKLTSSLLLCTAFFINNPVVADPITHDVEFICPSATDLVNFTDYIAGFGSAVLSSSTTTSIYFKTMSPIKAPGSLVNYSNSIANYYSSGYVSCSYASSCSSESPFEIFYHLTNGKGGNILSQTSNAIRVQFVLALK